MKWDEEWAWRVVKWTFKLHPKSDGRAKRKCEFCTFQKKWVNNLRGKMKICTYILSVSCGIFLGTVDSPRCEQSTVLPVHVQSRGHFDVNMLSPRPLRLRLELKCEPNGSAVTSIGNVADINRREAKIVVNILLLWITWFMLMNFKTSSERVYLFHSNEDLWSDWSLLLLLILFYYIFISCAALCIWNISNDTMVSCSAASNSINWWTSVRTRQR